MVWGPDGREIIFSSVVDGTRHLMRAEVSAEDDLSIGAPERMFAHPTLRGPPGNVGLYAIAPDGARILTVEAGEPLGEPPEPVVWLVENWGRRLDSAN